LLLRSWPAAALRQTWNLQAAASIEYSLTKRFIDEDCSALANRGFIMAFWLVCPTCSSKMKTASAVPVGRVVHCPTCKETYRVSEGNSKEIADAEPDRSSAPRRFTEPSRVDKERLPPETRPTPASKARPFANRAPLSLDDSQDVRDNSARPRRDSSTERPAELTAIEMVRHVWRRRKTSILICAAALALSAFFVIDLAVFLGGSKGTRTNSDNGAARYSSSGGGGAALSSEEIYRRQVLSSALIVADRTGQGSGCLIDKDQRLVATAYHVVQGAKNLKVLMPKLKDGKAQGDFNSYGPNDTTNATVVVSDPSKDLAILRLDWVPSHVRELPLASSSPDPGEEVHTVGGSPRGSIGLWVYTKGNVREVQEDRQRLSTGQNLKAWVIRTSNPSNPGDSGAALTNSKCELVGICSGARTDADLVRIFIDVRELRELLNRNSLQFHFR